MGDEFTPDELKMLVDAGELTTNDLLLLSKRNAQTAGHMLMNSGKMEVTGPGGISLPGPAMISGVASTVGNAIGKIPLPSTAGLGGLAAQMGVDALGQKLGLPWWITGPISHRVGKMGGGGSAPAPAKAPKPAPAPKPWGQRSAPVAGSKQYGPQDSPSRVLARPSEPSNLERHGNVTRPGPDAAKGGGGPSRPSGPVDNPASRSSNWKGPMGNEDNWKTIPNKSVGADLNKDRRKAGPRDDVSDRRYQELRAKFGGTPGARREPLSTFDEADRRKVVFGGVGNSSSGGYKHPTDRKPLSKKDIEELIANLLKMR